VQGLRAGALGEEIEARLRGVTEPSVEKPKEAKMAGKKDAKEKAGSCGQTEKNKKNSSGDPEKEL
jgi:hypothetical protein